MIKPNRVKTATVLQMEAVECGAAALAIILAYYGLIMPLEELRILCGISRDGSKASNIVKAARHLGLDAKGYRYDIPALHNMTFPVILFWEFNHFLVLEGFGPDKVYLNDPGCGPRVVSNAEFDKSYTGVVIEFTVTPNFKPAGRQKNIIERLWPRLEQLKTALMFVLIASLALVFPGLLIPTFTKIFIDDYLISGNADWIRPLLMGMLVTALIRAALTALQQKYLLRLEKRLSISMSSDFFWHVLRLPLEFFQQRFAGDIAQRVKSNDTVAQLLAGSFATNAVNILMLVFFAFLMYQYNAVLATFSIILGSINLFALKHIAKLQKDGNLKMQQDHAKLFGTTMGGIQIMETLKATGSESDFFSTWSGYSVKVRNTAQKIGLPLRALERLPELLSAISNTIVLGYGGYQIMQGGMTVGTLVAFQSLLSSFMAPVNQLVGLTTQLQNIEADVTRLDDVKRYPIDPLTIERDISQLTEAATFTHLSGSLEMRDIRFGYSLLEPPFIEDFNLSLKPGQRIALVGGSGSGKSTIAKLIVGLNKPWGGEILFDGYCREVIPRQTLVSSLAHVDQDIILFSGSVRENLCLWDKSIPEPRLVQAAKDAQIHELISLRPGGYDSEVNERGSNFSGGQAQRLEIARALVQEPSLLVLDEATAALDPLTEQQIDNNIRRRGCACIIIAHRLSTIRDVDEIIVMEQGKVVQRGTHDTLINQPGLYANLIQLQ